MFLKLLNKFLSLIVRLKYGKLTPDVRYYYRHTYYCRLVQLKYIFKDYVIKKPYKEILFSAASFTKELYFFSPHHEESFTTRTDEGNYNYEIPRVLYSQDYNIFKWAMVPLKETYRNDIYVYDKPILIIANRYNSEWNGPPISFYSIETLAFIIEKLKGFYTIIYNRPRPQNITMDTSDIYDMNEFDWIKKEHPEVLLMEDLFKENKANAKNFNHFQMMVYANADHFISIHGGTAALASYFKGINLILSKKGPEHHFHCFEKLFPKLSEAKILHAKNDDDVKRFVEQYYVPKSKSE
jgi:hypothetical protein